MKFWLILKRRPRLFWSDIFLTLLPAVAWVSIVTMRPAWVTTRCSSIPNECLQEKVFFPDQFSLGMGSEKADQYSFWTQNLSGGLALVTPVFWMSGLVLAKSITPATALFAVGVDLVIILQSIAWNGFFTEGTKLLTQRPRPFVYEDTSRLGKDPAHYTSFYSGHTSFSAATGAAALFIMIGNGAPTILVWATGICATSLIALTGTFRVMAGRHFLTDVIVGSLAGILVSLLVAYFHRKPYLNSE